MKIEQIMAQTPISRIRALKDRPLVSREGTPAIRMLPAMPIEVIYDPMRVEVSYERTGEDIVYRFRYAKSVGYTENRLNAYQLRETFLGIRTPGEALDFLGLTGHFRAHNEDKVHESLTWNDFQRWQELVRAVLIVGPLRSEVLYSSQTMVEIGFDLPDHLKSLMRDVTLSEMRWLESRPEHLVIRSELESSKPNARKTLYAEITPHSSLEAILATVYVDGLNGVSYKLCGLNDCPRVFEVTSKHEREYCSQACAHKASVRRRRAEAKSKKTIKRKGIQSNGNFQTG
jgi:hypothetical protein